MLLMEDIGCGSHAYMRICVHTSFGTLTKDDVEMTSEKEQ